MLAATDPSSGPDRDHAVGAIENKRHFLDEPANPFAPDQPTKGQNQDAVLSDSELVMHD